MSWLFKSLQFNDPEEYSSSSPENQQRQSPTSRGGVKEDFSVIGDTIGRQFRGVANFLAPPPLSAGKESQPSGSSPSSQKLIGIRNDLAEIGGSLKSGLSLLSANKAVTEISKFTSNFLHFQADKEDEDDYDDDGDYVAGITEEIIDFVKEISTRPECWIDFPLSLDKDFRMSEAQREHALSVERIVPGLAALRANLVHGEMGDGQFWMVYFILLLPRLSDYDFEILSSPQIVETRNLLLQKLRNNRNMKMDGTENLTTHHASQEGYKGDETRVEDIRPSRETEVIEIVNATKGLEIENEESNEGWLEETDIDTGTSADNQQKLQREEDVSFSDLEDDDNDLSTRILASRQAQGNRAPSPGGSTDWVQLNESSETQDGTHNLTPSISRDKDSDVESNDWLKVDEFD